MNKFIRSLHSQNYFGYSYKWRIRISKNTFNTDRQLYWMRVNGWNTIPNNNNNNNINIHNSYNNNNSIIIIMIIIIMITIIIFFVSCIPVAFSTYNIMISHTVSMPFWRSWILLPWLYSLDLFCKLTLTTWFTTLHHRQSHPTFTQSFGSVIKKTLPLRIRAFNKTTEIKNGCPYFNISIINKLKFQESTIHPISLICLVIRKYCYFNA